MAVFDHINNNTIDEISILPKNCVYKLNCKDCGKVYVGETGRAFEVRSREHAIEKGDKTANSSYTMHFTEREHTFFYSI